ncbi:MAG: hypothetical protein ABIF04_00820 [Chloroflexota bacterium]
MTNPIGRPEYSPAATVEQALNRWWVIVLMIILGGAMGWLFPISQPPIYEAESTLAVSIDFPPGGAMSQYEEDYTFGMTSALIASTAVMERVVAQAQAQGLEIQVGQFNTYLEIKQSIWKLRVRYNDPQIAAKLANIWAEEAYTTLEQSRGHALQAQSLQGQENILAGCLSSACAGYSLSEVQEVLKTVSAQLVNEKNASNGIPQTLLFAFTDEALPPGRPVAYDRSKMILGGALIGFVVGIWGVSFWHIHKRVVEGGSLA